MIKKIVSAAISITMLSSAFTGINPASVNAAESEPIDMGSVQYQTTARQMESLSRGLIAAYRVADSRTVFPEDAGVYLSWRLLGDESLENQAFDIYKNGAFLASTGGNDATNYIDTSGTLADYYQVIKAGGSETEAANEPKVYPRTNYTAKAGEVGAGRSEPNSYTYIDIPIERPAPVQRMGDEKTSYYHTYDKEHEGGANDASIGDLDGDGDYEIVLKWDPTDSKDSSGADYTGNVYIDAYEIDENNGGYKWRIDLGKNVTAGQHYTQFIVYDFDGDGRSELAVQTAPGSKDGQGRYVSEAGDTDEIRKVDNTKSYIGTSGGSKGKNIGPEYYTIFDGETGAAISTTAAIPLGKSENWGDSKYNRAERFLAGVAYLDGVTPSLIECRGYYKRAVIRAYSFDGESLSMQWEYNSGDSGLYGQGNHSLSISDIDGDGYDEIVYGSACLDHDGKTVLGNTKLGHGDAMHVNDFNNDGIQEAFTVKEEEAGYKNNAANFRIPKTGDILWGKGASGDTGRGVMANIDDEYASKNPDGLALAWSSSHSNLFDLKGNEIAAKPTAGSRTMTNFLVYWDGDLGRELLDDNIIGKYRVEEGSMKRFYSSDNAYSLSGSVSNNYSKRHPSLVADLWGDWREEIIMPVGKNEGETPYLRIFTSTLPTKYRLTTLMHDSQYRCAVAWQNVGYNQPPHTSYYVGSAALAPDSNGAPLNYLAPAVNYTRVSYNIGSADVTGIEFLDGDASVEKGKSVTLNTILTPSGATAKGVKWISSNPDIAAVSNGIVKGISDGTAKITATSKADGTVKAECSVTVYTNYVTDISLSESAMRLGQGYSKRLSAYITPENATDSSVSWTSSNPMVAAVDSSGMVTGLATGVATITAKSTDGGKIASCTVNVLPLKSTDITGNNKFTTTNSDSDSVLSSSKTDGASFKQTNATVGGAFYKTFKSLNDSHATLKFTFKTGGNKIDGANWNWDGHEYSFYVKLLGADDQNIITLSQSYTTGSQPTLSKIGTMSADDAKSSWSVVDKSTDDTVKIYDPFGGSSRTWHVTADFDYENGACDITILDETDTKGYTTSFDLNGLSLEKLEFASSVDGNGGIYWSPTVSDLSYSKITTQGGLTNLLYEKGTSEFNAWTESDISEWTKVGATELMVDTDSVANGRIYYNPTKPSSSYSSEKSFELTEGSVVTYNVDWYFGNSTARASNVTYIQFGSDLRIGWNYNSGYHVYASVDNVVMPDNSLFSSKGIFTKNIKVEIDTTSKTIKSLKFDGKTVDEYTDFKLSDDAVINTVSFGFSRGGATGDWGLPCGIDSIVVSEFTEEEEIEDPNESEEPAEPEELTIGEFKLSGNEKVTIDVSNTTSKSANLRLIVASYDENGTLVNVSLSDCSVVSANSRVTLEADSPLTERYKVMLWNSMDGLSPLIDAVDNL